MVTMSFVLVGKHTERVSHDLFQYACGVNEHSNAWPQQARIYLP